MIVDETYYKTEFGGSDFPDMSILLARAEKLIDTVISAVPSGEQQFKAYKNAICAQAEAMGLAGGLEAWAASTNGGGASFTIGSFSMGERRENSTASVAGISPSAISYLDNSGLLYRGVAVR